MAINPTAIASQDIATDTGFAVELLTTVPVAGAVFSPSRLPGQLVASFNGSTGQYTLWMVGPTGNKFYRIVS